MKQMYEDGDDEMKRTIAKAWTESRDKQGGEAPPFWLDQIRNITHDQHSFSSFKQWTFEPCIWTGAFFLSQKDSIVKCLPSYVIA